MKTSNILLLFLALFSIGLLLTNDSLVLLFGIPIWIVVFLTWAIVRMMEQKKNKQEPKTAIETVPISLHMEKTDNWIATPLSYRFNWRLD